MFVSYAQNFEDVMLWRAFKHIEHGFYIDIGAQDPLIDSISLAFYEHGWRGVHVEPNSYYAEKIRRARPDETVIQAAVGAKAGILKFFEVSDSGLSTGDEKIAEKHRLGGFSVRETDVPLLALASILDQYSDREIHWLKIDVEGMEQQILQSWLPSTIRPWLVVIESTFPLTQEERHEQWEHLLLELGYEFVYFDGLNRFYVSKKHREIKGAFRFGPNVFDGFALNGTASAPFCNQLNKQILALQQEAERLSQMVAEREHETSEAQAQLRQSREKFGQYMRTFKQHEQELANQLEKSNVYSQRLDEALGTAKAYNQRLENEWNVTKAKIDELNRHAHHWSTMAENLKWDIQVIYSSRSWRLTAPFRRIGAALSWWYSTIALFPRKIKAAIMAWVKLLLLYTMRFIVAHPTLKAQVLTWVKQYPSLETRLRRFAVVRGILPGVPEFLAPKVLIGTPAVLPESARRVYAKILMVMPNQRQGE